MTQLLVSVRDADEAAIALASGVSLIDVKEPDRGPLGAADAATICAVVDRIAGGVPVSVALGELTSGEAQPQHIPSQGVAFAKVGLAGCAEDPQWLGRWTEFAAGLPAGTSPVAVTYADWRLALAPSPHEVLSAARAVGCGAVLIDTFDKRRGSLTDLWHRRELAEYVHAIRQLGLLSVVAGSLCFKTIPLVLPIRPDYVAVRGAACHGKRTGSIDSDTVRRLVELVESGKQPAEKSNVCRKS